MSIINLIDCKTKKTTAVYLFISCMVSESTITSNISIFENLNISQLKCNKSDACFEKYLTF